MNIWRLLSTSSGFNFSFGRRSKKASCKQSDCVDRLHVVQHSRCSISIQTRLPLVQCVSSRWTSCAVHLSAVVLQDSAPTNSCFFRILSTCHSKEYMECVKQDIWHPAPQGARRSFGVTMLRPPFQPAFPPAGAWSSISPPNSTCAIV